MRKEVLSVKNFLKAAWVFMSLLSTAFWLPKVDGLLTKDYDTIKNDYVALDDFWNITIDGETYYDADLGKLRFPAVNKGSRIIMERDLPEDWEVVEGALRLYVRQAAVTVSVDGEAVYEYGYDRIAANKTVGSGIQFINFPNVYKGKKLTIRFDVAEDKAFSKLDTVRVYPWENAYRALMTENRLPLFFGSFLVIFGLAGCIMTTFAVVFSRKYIRLLCIFAFSLCMGLWTLCYYRVVSVYAIPIYAVSLMEHIAFYLAPLPLIIYMYDDVKRLKWQILRKLYWVILGGSIVSLTVMVTLHSMDIVHFAAMLPYMVGNIICCLIYFSIVIFINFKSGRATDRLYMVGMLTIIFCTVYDLVGYGGDRYYGYSGLMQVKGVSSIGVMGLIFLLFLSFYFDITQKMMQEAERNSLIKSAYTDELTKLYNRRYCMEHMNRLREEGNPDYTVVCFDLNNLKTVNDTCGHAKGDILIKSAAEVLTETFAKQGIVARMGGDEFIAVLDTADKGKIADCMERFRQNIDRKNKQVRDLNLSIACGYASGPEIEADIEKVYQTADNRMYEHKKRMKAGRPAF